MEFMYAIAFDLDTNALKVHYHPTNYPNAYKEVGDFLAERGFSNKQGSLYYGDKTVNYNTPALAVFDMSQKFSWLKKCVTDIRVLQLVVEGSDDLRPWIDRGNPNA